MTEKQKNKRGEERRYSRRTVLIALASILAIPFLFATFYLFRAYPLVEYYSNLSIVVAVGLTIVLIIFLFIGISIAEHNRDKAGLWLILLLILGSIVSRATLGWLSIFLNPIMLIALAYYTGFIMLVMNTVSLSQMLKMLGFAIVITNLVLMTQCFFMLHFQLQDSARVNGNSY